MPAAWTPTRHWAAPPDTRTAVSPYPGRVAEPGDAPDLSVILPCRNGASFLSEQLESLVAQEEPGAWELIVVDNGSTDESARIAASFEDRLPLTVVSAPERADVAYARNVGARIARADRLAFVDADDRLCPQWVRAITDALDHHALVTGVQSPDRSTSTPEAAAATGAYAPAFAPPARESFLPYAQGNAVGVQRRWFDRVGGFDERYPHSGADVAFSWSILLLGGDFAIAPGAIVHYRARGDLRSVFRQQFRVGQGQAFRFARFRGDGMPRSGAGEVLSRWVALVVALPAVAVSAQVRGRWVGTFARRLGRVAGSLQFRVVYL